jgi:hypothetical protein
VTPRHPAVTAPAWIILASGPSQNASDIETVRSVRVELLGAGLRVLAINNQVFAAPWADVLYSHDGAWWKAYSDADQRPDHAALLRAFPGERACWDDFGIPYGARPVPKERPVDGLGLTGVRSGCNSGFQAINLAFLRGAKTIITTGYDMQHASDGRRHNHADHPAPLGNFSAGMPEMCRRHMGTIARPLRELGVRVINASRSTALTCFERMTLTDAIDVARARLTQHPAPPVASPALCGLS